MIVAMKTNVLQAIANIVQNPKNELTKEYKSINRINSVGDALEFYVKDAFCGTLQERRRAKKDKIYAHHFSYIGNQNNPPDVIIRGGDAFEIKKVVGLRSGLALNSSYPKDKLYSDDPMLLRACRDCEEWDVKDHVYVLGVVPESKIKALWFVYGDCYAAERSTYERVKEKIINGVKEIRGVELSKTVELGKVKRVDPLGITILRVRGLWHIETPVKVFEHLGAINEKADFNLVALMKKEKYMSFPQKLRGGIESLGRAGLKIKDVDIKSPNNPAQILDAKLITYSK